MRIHVEIGSLKDPWHHDGRLNFNRRLFPGVKPFDKPRGEIAFDGVFLLIHVVGIEQHGIYSMTDKFDSRHTHHASFFVLFKGRGILRAHLLASGAENAAYVGDMKNVEAKLSLSEDFIKNLPAHEEFDHASWHQHAGACALILGHYDSAIRHLEQTIDELPPQWTLRHATTLMPLALAYARRQERDASLAIAEKAISVISALNAPSLSKQFVAYMQKEFIGSFPGDPHIHTFVADTEQRLLPTKATATGAQAS